MNNKQPSSAAVGVKIHADLYSTLEGLQEKFSEELGLDLSLSQTIAVVVHEYFHYEAYKAHKASTTLTTEDTNHE